MNYKDYLKGISAITLIMTTDCNLRCKYCFTRNYGYKPEYVDQKVFIDFINELQEIKNGGSIDNLFFGGEPFLHLDQMNEIQEYYQKKDFIYSNTRMLFSIVTNGTIVNDKTVEFINKYLHNIQFSIDGNISVNDKNRITRNNRGSYYLILNQLSKHLENINTNISIKQTYDPYNQLHMLENYIDQYQNFFHPLKNISFTSMVIRNSDIFTQEEQIQYIDEYAKTYEWWYENFIKKGFYKEQTFFGEFTRNVQDINGSLNNFFTTEQKTPCGQGKALLGIDQNGNIYPCHHFQYSEPGYSDFNLLTYKQNGDLQKINLEKLQKFNSYNLIKGPCKHCQASQNCYYCLAENYQYRKDLNQPDKKICLSSRSENSIQMAYYKKILQTNNDFINYINSFEYTIPKNDIVNYSMI